MIQFLSGSRLNDLVVSRGFFLANHGQSALSLLSDGRMFSERLISHVVHKLSLSKFIAQLFTRFLSTVSGEDLRPGQENRSLGLKKRTSRFSE